MGKKACFAFGLVTSVACKVLPSLERPARNEDIVFISSSPKLGSDADHDRRIRRQAECQDENDNCALFEEFCSDKYFSEVCPQTCGACEGKPVFGNLDIFGVRETLTIQKTGQHRLQKN